jgi:hypothetical protein
MQMLFVCSVVKQPVKAYLPQDGWSTPVHPRLMLAGLQHMHEKLLHRKAAAYAPPPPGCRHFRAIKCHRWT